METALYLLPVTLGDTSIEKVLPSYNKEIISGIRYFIVEDVRSARRFLKKVDREIDIDALTFYPLNKHTSPDDISGYLQPLVGGVFLPEILVYVLKGDVVLIQRMDKGSQVLLPCPLVQKGLSGFCGSIPFHDGIAKTQQVFSCRVLVLQHSLQHFHGDDAIGGKK